jgi:hypothetical protein
MWPKDNNPTKPYVVYYQNQFELPLDVVSSQVDLMGQYLGIPVTGAPIVPLISRFAINPSIGPIFWLGASYEDNWPNYYAIQSLTAPTTFSGSWAFLVNATLGQNSVGRWTTAGSVAGNLGRIYAVSGASWSNYITGVNTTIATQTAKLISDYPGGLPTGSVVVIHCGINEMQFGGNLIGGGIFSTDGTTVTWAQSGFTMPANLANINVTVTNSAQCVAGANNLVFVNGLYLMTVQAVPDGTHITLTNSFNNTQGTVVAAGNMQAYSATTIAANITAAQTGITNLISAGVSQIYFVICPNLGQLPNFSGQAALATTTWNYWKTQAKASLYPNTAKQVAVFDVSAVTNNIVTNPTNYGFKDATTQWNNSVTINQNDLLFFDGFHQNAPGHVEIAHQFFSTIRNRSYLSLY